MRKAEGAAAASARKRRKQDPEGVRADILAVATREFAEHGLTGARIDEIAAKTDTSKRMIYYYFGDKAGLYRHVLEAAYARVRAGEAELSLDHLEPVEALRKLIEFTVDHHRGNPDFVRLVMIENIHRAEHLQASETIEPLNRGAVGHVERIYCAGTAAGCFRDGLDPLEIHWLISGLAFFPVSNRATFAKIFGWRRLGPDGAEALKRQAVEAVLRFTLTPAMVEAHLGAEAGDPPAPRKRKASGRG